MTTIPDGLPTERDHLVDQDAPQNTPFDDAKVLVIEKLGKPDRSRKGGVDDDAWPFINTINTLNDFYTTSSCAGRVNVFQEPVSGKKRDAQWLYVTHDEADEREVRRTLQNIPMEGTIWLRMESPIFHIACRDTESADALLKLVQRKGWKRSGIISTGGKTARKKRVMIEILGNERIDSPVAANGESFFDSKFTAFLVDKANQKLMNARERLEDLRAEIEHEFA